MLEEIWTEKYRPKLLKDIAGQEEITKRLELFVKNRSLPHCLFAGPAGVGKTTTALAIAHELFGPGWKSNFLDLNASDERGIDIIRIKVKDFARTMPLSGLFKIVYLDEADALTKDAQHALRRTMENYAATCRFILSCNYSSRIILPIQSRTAVFRFSQLKEDDISGFLKKIASAEGLQVDESAYKSIVYLSEGDMRRAVNILQTAAVLGGKITEQTVYAVTNKADPKEVRMMIEDALRGQFMPARERLVSLLHGRGLAGEDLIKEIYSQTLLMDINDLTKLSMIEKIGECEFRLTEGSNPRIQLEAFLAQLALVAKSSK